LEGNVILLINNFYITSRHDITGKLHTWHEATIAHSLTPNNPQLEQVQSQILSNIHSRMKLQIFFHPGKNSMLTRPMLIIQILFTNYDIITECLTLAFCSEHFISIKHRILATFNIKKNSILTKSSLKLFVNNIKGDVVY
jgi:hypothetical protein